MKNAEIQIVFPNYYCKSVFPCWQKAGKIENSKRVAQDILHNVGSSKSEVADEQK